MMNNPGRYKLHQYLKYAHQWADTVSYKCRLYLILDNGKIVKPINNNNLKGIFMIEIDLNDTVSVELTEWGAAYLNATNIFKEITTTQKMAL